MAMWSADLTLRREIQDRIDGVQTICGPPIADWPSPWKRLWPWGPPNYELEARLRRSSASWLEA